MKILWIIDRLDGSQVRHITEEAVAPVSGDGAIVEGIPVKVGSKATTPMASLAEKHDLAIAAIEQKL